MIGVFQIRKHCVFDFERQLSLNDARKRKKPDIIGRFLCLGGADGDRTHDLLHAMEALSQLSYSPKRTFYSRNYCIISKSLSQLF